MAVRYDNTLIYQIQQANDIVDLVSEHVSLTRKGREMVGLCPFHDDHRPSMYVNSAKQIFKCFACGAGGDVFKFVQMRENLTFGQAIERLAHRAGIKLPTPKRTKEQGQRLTEDIDPNQLAKVNAWAVKHFQKNLFKTELGKSTLKYLDERQISIESIKQWQIGLALENGNELVRASKSSKVPDALLKQAGLVVQQGGRVMDKFVKRLMFVITDVTGRVIGFGGRILEGEGAKYINSPTTPLFDKSTSLYGLQFARESIVSNELAVVVEGYTDCIMAHEKGCKNVVATLGTSFTNGHARLLRRYAKTVVLVFDGDIAGTEAANRAMEVCLSEHVDIKLATVPDSKDPCEFLVDSGKDAFEALVETAMEVFEYKWSRLIKQFKGDDTLRGRRQAIDELLQTLAITMQAYPQAVTDRGLIINRLSNLLGLETKQINAELDKRLRRAPRPATVHSENQKAAKVVIGSGLRAQAQREILEVLLNEPNLFERLEEKITIDIFNEPILRRIAEVVYLTLKEEPGAGPSKIMTRIESLEAGSLLAELTQSGQEKGNFEKRLDEAIEVLLRQQKRSEIQALEDKDKYLRRLADEAGDENRHSLGMIY
ncbi:MAG: DNA primase [Planctomycetota bacterium]|jgi:DNA primase